MLRLAVVLALSSGLFVNEAAAADASVGYASMVDKTTTLRDFRANKYGVMEGSVLSFRTVGDRVESIEFVIESTAIDLGELSALTKSGVSTFRDRQELGEGLNERLRDPSWHERGPGSGFVLGVLGEDGKSGFRIEATLAERSHSVTDGDLVNRLRYLGKSVYQTGASGAEFMGALHTGNGWVAVEAGLDTVGGVIGIMYALTTDDEIGSNDEPMDAWDVAWAGVGVVGVVLDGGYELQDEESKDSTGDPEADAADDGDKLRWFWEDDEEDETPPKECEEGDEDCKETGEGDDETTVPHGDPESDPTGEEWDRLLAIAALLGLDLRPELSGSSLDTVTNTGDPRDGDSGAFPSGEGSLGFTLIERLCVLSNPCARGPEIEPIYAEALLESDPRGGPGPDWTNILGIDVDYASSGFTGTAWGGTLETALDREDLANINAGDVADVVVEF